MSAEAAKCHSCGDPIVWARTSSGKLMPMDAKPAENGTFFLFRVKNLVKDKESIEAVSISALTSRGASARARGDKRYTSHFATCPQADQHRRAKV